MTIHVPDYVCHRDQYSLDPDVVYLNHGSFGAVPVLVQDAFHFWHRRMEANPSRFMHEIRVPALAESRRVLARFVGTRSANLGFVNNATHGVNVVAHSLPLQAGDEVLATSQEYGATQKAVMYQCQRAGAQYRIQDIPYPVQDREAWIEAFWQGVTSRTRVIFFSHITSATALTLPLPELCQRARAAGIVTLVDGAHAPGHIDLKLDAWDVDFYTGNCHKWLSSPRGCGFLYAHPRHHAMLEPLIVSHGWNPGQDSESPLFDYLDWQGTQDPCAILSVPSAIQYLYDLSWHRVRRKMHALAVATRHQLSELFGLDPVCPDGQGWYSQMFTARLPDGAAARLGNRLWEEHRIIVPVMRLPEHDVIRVSLKEYNSLEDVNTLVNVLAAELS